MNNQLQKIPEDHGEDDAAPSPWSYSESSLPDAPCQAPPVSNPIPPPYPQALSLAPREMPSIPPAPPDDAYPYPYRKNGISINVDSKQINSMGSLRSVSSDIPSRSIKLDMINRNVLTFSPAISALLSYNRDSSTPKSAAPNPHTFPGDGISLSVKARQINSVRGLSNSVLANHPRKELDTFNQDVLTSAPQIAAPVPTDPSPKEKYTFLEPERASPVPNLHAEYRPQDEIRDLDCAPQIAPCIQDYNAPRRASPIIGPCLCQEYRPRALRSPECAPHPQPMGRIVSPAPHPQPMARIVSPAPTIHSTRDECVFLAPSAHIHREARIASPTSTEFSSRVASPLNPEPTCDRIGIVSEIQEAPSVPPLEPGNQDVFSLPPRKASPVCMAPQAIPPSHPLPENNLCSVPLVSCSNRCQALVNDIRAPFVSCQCRCPQQVQRSCPFVSLVPCQNLVSNHHEVRGYVPLVSCPHLGATQENEATVSCSRLHGNQENEATTPFVSKINSHENNAVLNANPLVCQEDVLNTAKSKRISSGGVGLSNPVLFDTRRKKLDMLNRLYTLGIQGDIDVPSIVVIGSQSAGKSSFIESISGINLPRSGGACTRCPIECRLIRKTGCELWQCTVTLRFLTDEKGKPLDVARNIAFGSIINDPNDVEGRLRRAQLAILSPHIPLEVFLDDNTQLEHNSSSFSSNVISLEIRSPDVTDLSFYDLPGGTIITHPSCSSNRFIGLIASVRDGGRDEDVEDIRKLIISYIEKQNCIILLTVTCEADFETQGAYRLAKKYDPEGIRTIGVLTKPDRIPEGEYSRWFKLLRNEISPLQHGWFCVKQLSTIESQRGYSFEKSRRFCEKFFRTAPWDTLDALCRKRLGTKAVMVKLNDFLVSIISERIPEITQELLRLIRDSKDRIQALPAAPSSNPLFEVIYLINQFCDTLYGRSKGICMDGAGICEGFAPLSGNQVESIREVQERFRKAISETAPKFQPHARHAQTKYAHSHLPCGLTTEAGTTSTAAGIMYLDDVSAMVMRGVTIEQPGSHPHRVVQEFIKCYTEKWKMPALNIINDIFHVVTERQTQLLTCYFGRCTSGGLYHAVKYFNNAFDLPIPSGTDHKYRNLMNKYMQARKETLEKQVKSLINLESTAFMLNNPVFLNYKSDRLREHERIRQAYVNLGKDDLALSIITSVEAYFKVAHQRFIDNVRLAIDHNLVRIERRSLQEALYNGLDLMASNALDSCTKLIAENTQLSSLRAELEERLERLEAVQTELLIESD